MQPAVLTPHNPPRGLRAYPNNLARTRSTGQLTWLAPKNVQLENLNQAQLYLVEILSGTKKIVHQAHLARKSDLDHAIYAILEGAPFPPGSRTIHMTYP